MEATETEEATMGCSLKVRAGRVDTTGMTTTIDTARRLSALRTELAFVERSAAETAADGDDQRATYWADAAAWCRAEIRDLAAGVSA